jgi:hypothetical protein
LLPREEYTSSRTQHNTPHTPHTASFHAKGKRKLFLFHAIYYSSIKFKKGSIVWFTRTECSNKKKMRKERKERKKEERKEEEGYRTISTLEMDQCCV